MDHSLVAWARRVKARRRGSAVLAHLPVLWLFTDALRLPDPRLAIARLPWRMPRHLFGVVFRHDGVEGRAALARALARQCRPLGIALVVAGDARLAAAIGAGVHLRGGWPTRHRRRRGTLLTSSAHTAAELQRAQQAGADAIFLSPTFPTQSHPGAPALGAVRWAALARQRRVQGMAESAIHALGGVNGRVIRRLARGCQGAGFIDASGLAAGVRGPSATVFRNYHKTGPGPIAAHASTRQ